MKGLKEERSGELHSLVITEKRRGYHREKEGISQRKGGGGHRGKKGLSQRKGGGFTEGRRREHLEKEVGGHRCKKGGNQLTFGVWRGCALVTARTKSTRETMS